MGFQIKRVYEEPAVADGFRVLVDRLWPRGLSKVKAELNEWLKEVAPSAELRTWFGHVPERFDEFRARYREELDANDAVERLRAMGEEHEVVTLLYSAHDERFNQAVVLLEYLSPAASAS